jgi:hypothetical protein
MPNESYKAWHRPQREQLNENGNLKKGKTHQGYARITNLSKYIGDPNLIIYRSGWERDFINWCDATPSVISWSSEPVKVLYYDKVSKLVECAKFGLDPNNPANWLKRNYNVDFFIEIQRAEIEKWFVEIKPADKLIKPKALGESASIKQKRNFNIVAREFLINEEKFKAATKFAEDRNAKFYVFTEKTLPSLIGPFFHNYYNNV